MPHGFRYDVDILHLLVSPDHAYFGRARDGVADVRSDDADRVEVVAGKGIVGDRFFGKAAHMDAAVTLEDEGFDVPMWQPRMEIYLDVSGSMPNPCLAVNAMTLAARNRPR